MFLRTAIRSLLVFGSCLGLVACATPEPSVQKVDARPLKPRAGEKVVVDQLLIVVDASSSLDGGEMFYQERALVESFVSASPDGGYDAGAVAFGGSKRHQIPLTRFDRGRLKSETAQLPYLQSGTPVHKVLGESQDTLGSGKGRAAVVIFSDGVFTDEFGREVETERVVTAAKELAKSHAGPVCFHTVQVGSSDAGAENLRRVTKVTACGTTRSAAGIGNETQLHAMSRAVFIGAAPVAAKKPALPPVSAPAAKKAPMQMSWSVNFPLDSAQVAPRYRSEMGEIATRLQASPGARVLISGHTDTSGNAEYNRGLSMRRAQATREALVAAGVDPQRIDVKAFGSNALRVPETSAANRAANRRTEIEILR